MLLTSRHGKKTLARSFTLNLITMPIMVKMKVPLWTKEYGRNVRLLISP
jgi:hypothetical protein